MKRRWLIVLAILGTICVGGYAALCGLVYGYQDKLLYFPSSYIEADPLSAGLEFEEFEIEVEPGVTVVGWIVESRTSQAPWVVQFHGNAGNISHRIDHLSLFNNLGFNGVVFDYRGYGKSTGVPTEKGLVADGVALVDYLQKERGVDPRRIVYWGESLGGGVAAAVADVRPPRALILKSTFTSVPDRGAEAYPFLPVRLLSKTKFETSRLLPNFLFPKLIIHAEADSVVAFHHGQRLYQLASQPKIFFASRGGHNTSPLELGSDFEETVKRFVTEAMPGRD